LYQLRCQENKKDEKPLRRKQAPRRKTRKVKSSKKKRTAYSIGMSSENFNRKLFQKNNCGIINVSYFLVDNTSMHKLRKKRVPSKGGFTRFFKNDEEQRECESLQMQLINYLNNNSVPWD